MIQAVRRIQLPECLTDTILTKQGCACGGSYANKRYSDLLAKRLSSEDYLWMNGDTLGAFVDSLIPDFESNYKRMFDVVRNPPTPAHAVSINGLRGDRQMGRTGSDLKRFEDNKLVMDRYVLLSLNTVQTFL